MKSSNCSFSWCRIGIIILLIAIKPATAQENNRFKERSQKSIDTISNSNNYQQAKKAKLSISAKDLLVQNNLTRVTGVDINQTESGLELILKTVAGSERLVPLILPEGNDLVIDILDATLAFSIRNGVTELNPTPGIRRVAVNRGDKNSIRVRITGENKTPSAEIVPGRNDLVLNIAPESTTAEDEPDEEIEVIATGEAEEDGYNPTDSGTAIGTNTPIKDTPLSIEVVPQEVIKDRNVRELGDALETVPGVVEAGGRGSSVFGPNFKIRGFDLSNSFSGGFFKDGIPTDTLAPISTNDIERVEVLKGPASVLFGQAEPGGIINLVTKKPLDEPFYEIAFGAGNFDTYEGALDFSAPLNESKTVKYRLNISYENYESFRDFVNGDRFLFSPRLTWDIGNNTSIDFFGQYVSDTETVDSGIPAQGDGIVDVPRERFLDEDFGEAEQDQFRLGYRLNHRFDDTWSVRHSLEYREFEGSRFGVLFDEFDETTGELTRFEYATDETYKRFFTNAEAIAEFKTGSIEHQVLFGTEYRHYINQPGFEFSDPFASINVFNPVYNEPFEIDLDFFRDDNVDSIGVYLQDQIDLLPNLIVLAGVRFDYVDQFRTEQNLGEEREEFVQEDSDFTPRFGIVYKPIEPVSVYASYTTSFSPTFGASRNADDSTFEPETGRQFEVGVKTDITDKLSFTFAAFDIRKQNVSTTDPDNFLFSIQTGEQASRGIELDINGEILPGWKITAAYTYLDAFVSEDNTDIVDNELPGAPESQFGLWTTYNIQQGSLEGLGFGLGFLALSDRQGDLENTFTLPGYFRTDAALFYKRDNWRTQLNIENLFDIEYFASTNFDSRLGVNPGAPFTISGTVAVEF